MKRLLVLLVVLAAVAGSAVFYGPTHEGTCTVSGKDRAGGLGQQPQMRVYTRECGTFVVQDNWLHGLTDSADLYGALVPGQRYDLVWTGWRLGVTSTFPGLVGATPR